jgi:hypothetical protein
MLALAVCRVAELLSVAELSVVRADYAEAVVLGVAVRAFPAGEAGRARTGRIPVAGAGAHSRGTDGIADPAILAGIGG